MTHRKTSDLTHKMWKETVQALDEKVHGDVKDTIFEVILAHQRMKQPVQTATIEIIINMAKK